MQHDRTSDRSCQHCYSERMSFLKFVIIVIALIPVLLFLRTVQMATTPDQKEFLKGTLGTMLPDGLYTGSVSGSPVSWTGKKFDNTTMTGINLFVEKDGSTNQKYPFVFSTSEGAYDPIQVIRIDYNLPTNPFWLRPVLDEIVQVAPGKYLGKLQVRIIPYYPFTLTFFTLIHS
jgi:hypothetical protein